jgi:hypothetical protein
VNAVLSEPGQSVAARRGIPAKVMLARLRDEVASLEASVAVGRPRPRTRRPVEPVGVDVAREIRFLKHVAAGLATSPGEELPFEHAGAGSVLRARDLRWGRERLYKLMPGPLDRLDAGQVRIDSAPGRALLNREAGEIVTLRDAGTEKRLLITLMTTLPQRLGMRPG